MGKQNQGTKFLYRKSNCTLNTRSKTCSGASQFLTSGLHQLKKKLPNTHYYVEKGKLKRDLSIETDKCILRGHYKKKLGRFQCTVNKPYTETIVEPKCDHNSCGDSIRNDHYGKTRPNIDVNSLVVENFKDLLNDWITKYLLKNNKTKQKIETVLDSILHNLELKQTSSSYTYILDSKFDEKEQLNSNYTKTTKFVTCGKQSCRTVPVTGKHIQLISTLSIPRNIKKRDSHYLTQATRKIRYKNIFLTVSRSSTELFNSSSFHLLSISTKSFIKRCTTYDSQEIETNKNHKVVFVPKSSYSESMADTILREKVDLGLQSKVYPNALEIEPVQSLVKSIYADDPANITSTDRNVTRCKYDNYTMTDTDFILKNVTSTQCHIFNWKKINVTAEPEILKVRNKYKKNTRTKLFSQGHKKRKTKSKKKHMQSFKCLNKKMMDARNMYKKTNPTQNENNLLKDLQDILKHLTHSIDSKNIKFDVRINVFPGLENKIIDEANNEKCEKNTLPHGNLNAAYNVISMHILPKDKTTHLIRKNQSSSLYFLQKSQPKLISILDGAISPSKYVINKEKSNETTDKNTKTNNINIHSSSISKGLEIAKDISELRVLIRDLAITTENFVKEHLEHLKDKPHEPIVKEECDKVDHNISQNKLKTSPISKAVQYSYNKNQIISGLQLKKEPKKKDIQEFNNNLDKKSISYSVIESESILKVTDMTSITADLSTDIFINKKINYSLPKSTSLYEVTVGQSKRKLLAYYCDDLIKSRQYMPNHNKCCSSNTCKYTHFFHANNDNSQIINEKTCLGNNKIACEGLQQQKPFCEEGCEINSPVYSSSSIYIDIEDRKKIAVRSRSGMSFWEGLICCILLWIPVVIIFWLIYVYVIRDIIQPVNLAIGRTSLPLQRSSNNSLFHITFSDLGF